MNFTFAKIFARLRRLRNEFEHPHRASNSTLKTIQSSTPGKKRAKPKKSSSVLIVLAHLFLLINPTETGSINAIVNTRDDSPDPTDTDFTDVDFNSGKMHGHATFVQIGNVQTAFSYHHLAVHIDFEDFLRLSPLIIVTVRNGERQYSKRINSIKVRLALDNAKRQIHEVKIQIDPALDHLREVLGGHHIIPVPLTPRQKRQVIGIYGAVTGTIALGTSIYALYKVDELASEVASNRNYITANRMLVKSLRQKVENNELAMETVENIEDFQKYAVDLMRTYIYEIRGLTEGIVALRQYKLTAFMIEKAGLESQLSNMDNDLGRFHRIDKGMATYLNHPMSWAIGPSYANLVIHVPISSMDDTSPMKLMRLQQASIMGEGRRIVFDTPTRFIGVSSNGASHTPLSAEDLVSCKREENTFYCHDSTTRYSQPRTCIAGLYFRSHEHIKTCATVTEDLVDSVIQLTHTKYAIRFDGETHVSCNGTTSIITAPKQAQYKHVEVLPGCQLISRDFSITTPLTKVHGLAVARRIRFDIKDFARFNETVQQIKDRMELPEVEPIVPFSAEGFHFSIYIIICLAVITAVILLVCVCKYASCKRDKKKSEQEKGTSVTVNLSQPEPSAVINIPHQAIEYTPAPDVDSDEPDDSVSISITAADDSADDVTDTEEEESINGEGEGKESIRIPPAPSVLAAGAPYHAKVGPPVLSTSGMRLPDFHQEL